MTTRHPPRKGKVVFVGEDRDLWFDLHLEVSQTESPWELVFAHTAAQALVTMAESPFDAVVADSELPDMDGLRFLNEVMKRHPETLRFIRAPIAANPAGMKYVGTPHQHLLKPGDAQTVFSALSRAIKFQAWLPTGAAQILLSGLRKLPSAPRLYFQVVADLQSPAASVESVAAIIAQDMAMTAKLLQLANSALFGLQRQVSHPAEAVLYLGMETTKSVLLLAHSFSYFDRLRFRRGSSPRRSPPMPGPGPKSPANLLPRGCSTTSANSRWPPICRKNSGKPWPWRARRGRNFPKPKPKSLAPRTGNWALVCWPPGGCRRQSLKPWRCTITRCNC